VQLLNPDGSIAAVFGSPAPGPTVLPDPVAVAFDAAGLAYVVDQRRSRVLVFDRAGKIVGTIGSRGTGPGQLLSPSAIAFDAAGNVYVADTGNGRVARFAPSGGYLGSAGSLGTIRGLAVAPDGSRIYASDAGTNRIYVIAPDGADIAQISGRGTKPGKLRSPAELALDAAGNLWVADRGNHRVQSFAPDGTLLASFGERGTAPGQFLEPTGIAVDCRGVVTVADTGNNRVQAFQAAPAGVCGALPAVQSPPDPVLPTQPKPVPPELTVKPAGTRGVFAARSLRLRVRCDVPCRVSIAGRVLDRKTPKKGKTPSAAVRLNAQSLPAGKLTVVKASIAAADIRRLRGALHGRRGLVADLRVTASASDSAPTVVARRYQVTG
jgi:DNA-binding beta-propeller fold protein YncE